MKAVILCGGLGTRMRPLTNTIPKPMIDINGKPMLEYLIILCKKHNITKIYLAGFYLFDVIRRYFQNGEKWGVQLFYSEEPKAMGSAGALKLLEQKLKETVVVLNGDVMTALNLSNMLIFHCEKKAETTILVHKSSHPYDSELVKVDTDWRVKKFLPSPKPGDTFTNLTKSGTVILEPNILKSIPKATQYSIEKDLLPLLLHEKKKVYAYYSDEYSKDAGTLERLEQVKQEINLWA